MKREHTRGEPARYLPGMTREHIRALETATVQSGARNELSPANSEYLRELLSLLLTARFAPQGDYALRPAASRASCLLAPSFRTSVSC